MLDAVVRGQLQKVPCPAGTTVLLQEYLPVKVSWGVDGGEEEGKRGRDGKVVGDKVVGMDTQADELWAGTGLCTPSKQAEAYPGHLRGFLWPSLALLFYSHTPHLSSLPSTPALLLLPRPFLCILGPFNCPGLPLPATGSPDLRIRSLQLSSFRRHPGHWIQVCLWRLRRGSGDSYRAASPVHPRDSAAATGLPQVRPGLRPRLMLALWKLPL